MRKLQIPLYFVQEPEIVSIVIQEPELVSIVIQETVDCSHRYTGNR